VTWKIVDEADGKTVDMYQHPFDNKKAYILLEGLTHLKTEDAGKSWKKWQTEAIISYSQSPILPLTFHAGQPDYVIYHGRKCTDDFGFDCEERVCYQLGKLHPLHDG
jgi:hypothetical protein